MYFGYDSPEDHPTISDEELNLLRENVIQGILVLKFLKYFYDGQIIFRTKIKMKKKLSIN